MISTYMHPAAPASDELRAAMEDLHIRLACADRYTVSEGEVESHLLSVSPALAAEFRPDFMINTLNRGVGAQ